MYVCLLLLQAGYLSGDVLPPYSEHEVDVQGEGGGGGRVVTQGDRLNALKRERASYHHRTRMSSSDRFEGGLPPIAPPSFITVVALFPRVAFRVPTVPPVCFFTVITSVAFRVPTVPPVCFF